MAPGSLVRTTYAVAPAVVLIALLRRGSLRSVLLFLASLFGAANLLSYVIPQYLNQCLRKPQNLRLKYKAEWAVVTGASTGLGAAMATKLGSQGVNVVLVALDDEHLDKRVDTLTNDFPNVEFRKVGVNMNDSDGCLAAVQAATADVHISLLFNNAGYVYLSAFHKADLGRQLGNMECMVGCAVKLTDHFYKLMVESGRPGAIVFTTSQGAFFPSPLSTVYSGCKAFLQSYAEAMAVEAKPFGIDILSLQPGYMRSRFTADLPKLKLWSKLDLIGQDASEVADNVFRSVGRMTRLDSGIFSWGSRLLIKILDVNALVPLIAFFASRDADFKSVTG